VLLDSVKSLQVRLPNWAKPPLPPQDVRFGLTWKMNGGFDIKTTPVSSRHTISVLKKPHGSRRNRKDMIMTKTGELKMMVVASPRGRRRNVKKRRTSVEPPTMPCDTES
jgi:hypothetical protein